MRIGQVKSGLKPFASPRLVTKGGVRRAENESFKIESVSRSMLQELHSQSFFQKVQTAVYSKYGLYKDRKNLTV